MRTLALPVLVGLMVAVGGCSSDAEPSPMPTHSSSPSESAPESPSASPPTMPAEATGTSRAAAKAFVRHYFDQINYAALTGDTAPLRALSADDCESCDAIASNVERIYGDGGHIAEERWTVRSVDVLRVADGQATLSVGARIGREVIMDSGGVRTVKKGGKQPMTVFLAADGNSYVLARLDLVT